MQEPLGRRKFIATSGAVLPTIALGWVTRPALASYSVSVDIPGSLQSRELDLVALHTMESLRLHYLVDGKYDDDNLAQINHLLRDHRTDEVHTIDLRLLDSLHELSRLLSLEVPIHVLSGYRSPATNAKLRLASKAVAKRSFHMFGRAVDIRIPGFTAAQIRDAALSLHRGGVGYYPGLEFVHLDTGQVRSW